MMRSRDVLIGMEVTKLGDPGDGSPWRMTVDVWDGHAQKIVRYQVTGGHYNGWPEGPPERTLDDLARVQSDFSRADEIAAELDRLDREAIAKIEPIMTDLFRQQAIVLYGEDVVALLEKDEPL
jgi:hypothetical protein